jgi:uncharacterized protein
MAEFRTNVADLLHHPGARRPFVAADHIAGFSAGAARLDGLVTCDLVLEQVPDGVVARGTASSAWSAECSRCLVPIERPFTIGLAELFEANPVEGETYPLVDETVDVEGPLRDAIAGVLPVAPLCKDDCAGLCPMCGVDRNTTTCDCDLSTPDTRWDALNALKIDINEITN